MVVGDFFGGSGVTAKVAHDLGRRFMHVDVGVNSVQTARDRLKSAGASFRVFDIQDGVSLFRNPVQTMDKLKTLIVGLQNQDGLDAFWEGSIADSKLGTVPVYLPNLLDHTTKVLDEKLIARVINEALPALPDETARVVVYYVDIFDEDALKKFIHEHNMSGVDIELRDLKEVLDEVVLNDEAEFEKREVMGGWEVEITRFSSDRLAQKIDEYNQKRGLTGKAKSSLQQAADESEAEEAAPKKAPFKPIQISDEGLELIEWLSLDCTNSEGAWHSDTEIKIDKKGLGRCVTARRARTSGTPRSQVLASRCA
jgi:adenine-specific DNA-methyltransferase